jgi:hypothetical protein
MAAYLTLASRQEKSARLGTRDDLHKVDLDPRRRAGLEARGARHRDGLLGLQAVPAVGAIDHDDVPLAFAHVYMLALRMRTGNTPDKGGQSIVRLDECRSTGRVQVSAPGESACVRHACVLFAAATTRRRNAASSHRTRPTSSTHLCAVH